MAIAAVETTDTGKLEHLLAGKRNEIICYELYI